MQLLASRPAASPPAHRVRLSEQKAGKRAARSSGRAVSTEQTGGKTKTEQAASAESPATRATTVAVRTTVAPPTASISPSSALAPSVASKTTASGRPTVGSTPMSSATLSLMGASTTASALSTGTDSFAVELKGPIIAATVIFVTALTAVFALARRLGRPTR